MSTKKVNKEGLRKVIQELVVECKQELAAEAKVLNEGKEFEELRATIRSIAKEILTEGKKVDQSTTIKKGANKTNPLKKMQDGFEGDAKWYKGGKMKKEGVAKHMIKKGVNAKAKYASSTAAGSSKGKLPKETAKTTKKNYAEKEQK